MAPTPIEPHAHRWINTALAVLAGLTATLTAFHEHQVVKLNVVPCEAPGSIGTVPTASQGVLRPLSPQ